MRLRLVIGAGMAEYTTFKRWTLKQEADEADVVALVRSKIAPHYEKLPGCLRLELLRIQGSRSYLATQHWESRRRYAETWASPEIRQWRAEYAPTLEKWHEIMDFEAEWETEDVLGDI